jgi:hypothetical protein
MAFGGRPGRPVSVCEPLVTRRGHPGRANWPPLNRIGRLENRECLLMANPSLQRMARDRCSLHLLLRGAPPLSSLVGPRSLRMDKSDDHNGPVVGGLSEAIKDTLNYVPEPNADEPRDALRLRWLKRRILKVPLPPKLSWAGVRPSPGAATLASSGVTELSSVLGLSELAAPGDGRTPAVIQRCALVEVRFLDYLAGGGLRVRIPVRGLRHAL